jgi:hypothetical protein
MADSIARTFWSALTCQRFESGDESPHCYVNVKRQLSQREAVFLFVLMTVFSYSSST